MAADWHDRLLRELNAHDDMESYLDPEEALHYSLMCIAEDGLEPFVRAADELERVLDSNASDEEVSWALRQQSGPRQMPADGSDVRAYARHVLRRARQFTSDPSLIPPGDDRWYLEDRRPIRVSRFFGDEADANRFSTAVLRAHRDVVEQWHSDHLTPTLHLYADLGEPTGERLSRDDPEGEPETVTGAVVVLGATQDGEVAPERVVTAYPEQLDERWRSRFPDLCHVLGGLLHQDFHPRAGTWNAYRDMADFVREPVRRRVHAQLGELAALEPATIREVIDALGCCYAPQPEDDWRLPRWLRRWQWRLYGLPPWGEHSDGGNR